MIRKKSRALINGYFIRGALSNEAPSKWAGGDGPMRGVMIALLRLVLLATLAAALTSSRALGLHRGATPAGGGAAVMATIRPPSAVRITPAPAPAASAEMVNRAEQHLSTIGYWAGPSGDKASDLARCAILAFQRVEGRSQTGKLDAAGIEAALAATKPIPREAGYSHIEVDLHRQVLFVVDRNDGVRLVLPISSGSGKLYTFEGKTSRAVTPQGRFNVYRKVNGWRKAPLGTIYYPCYFNEGWAIHGSASVPNYPASHGCVRIPISTARELSDVTPLGTVVLIYGGPESPADARPR